MEKSYFLWFCWLGLGNPCHIATKTPLEKLHQNLGLADPHPPQLGQKTKFFDRSSMRAPLIVIFVIKTHSQLCSLVIFWKIYWFYLYFNGILMEELHLFWQWLKCNRAQTFGGKHFSSDRTLFFNFHQSLKMSEFESILGKLQTLQLPIGKFSLHGCY